MQISALTCAILMAGSTSVVAQVPQDTMLDVGGHRLHFVIRRGTEPVTVLMESGGGAALDGWAGLDEELSRRSGATVVTYDRAGFGTSELGPADLTPATQVQQIGAALERLGVPSRRIVVGHSYGGIMAILHAAAFPDQVAGLVLSDPMNSRFVDATGDFVYGTVPRITDPRNDAERATARMIATFRDALSVARRAEPALPMPMVVITSTRMYWRTEDALREWRASHEAIAAAVPGRRLVVAEGAGHDIPAERPELIVAAVLSLLRM
jgi:pimeloyl-ACP methyl ester carboxylesterase